MARSRRRRWGRRRAGLTAYFTQVRVRGPSVAPARKLTRLTYDPGAQLQPTWSPDGCFVAYASERAGNLDIWVRPVAGGDPVQVTKHSAADWQPDWSPDGSTIVFRSERDGGGLSMVPALGGPERKLTDFGYDPRWSPDGSRVLFSGSFQSWFPAKYYTVGLDGAPAREVRPDFFAFPFDARAGRLTGEGRSLTPPGLLAGAMTDLTPDGKKLVFVTWRTGDREDTDD